MGVLAASGAENCTRIGAAPLTPFAPAAGVTDSTCSGPAGRSCWAAAWTAETGAAWLPGDPKVTIATPATKTIAAPPAVKAAPRRRLDRDPLGLAAVIPSAASIGCCLRNHPDPHTAPSPLRDFATGLILHDVHEANLKR
jgi:hypothetical protein